MYATDTFKARALFLVTFALQMEAVGRSGKEELEKFVEMTQPSGDPQPAFQLFQKVKWKDTGAEGTIYGLELIGGQFFYAVMPPDQAGDTDTAEEHEITAYV